MMYKKLLIAAISVLSFNTNFAQDEEVNLVPNGDFEATDTKRLKSFGQMAEFTENWFNGTQAPCDVFAGGIKSEKVSIPSNEFGKQAAQSGNIYTGIRAYTKDSKLSRTYLEVQFTEKLEKDQMYCVEFSISMADLSKYAVNNIGAVVSERKVVQPNTGAMVRDIDVKERTNKVFKAMDAWETVCGTVVGTGEEEYLIIGCFAGDSDLTIEKNKRPRDVVGSQKFEAYYYIDDVKVYPVDAKSQCSCSVGTSTEPDLIYGSSIVTSPDMSASDVVGISAVYYPFLKRSVSAAGVNTLESLVTILQDNPTWKLEIIGHVDNDEADEAKINSRYVDFGKQRAEQVKRFLVSKGIAEGRLIVLTKENTDPANTRETDLSRAQNRRVTFAIRN